MALFEAIGMTEVEPTIHPDKYEVMGSDMQVLTVSLSPGEMITCEPGAMMYMDPKIGAGVNCNDCFSRCISGEKCIQSDFTNNGQQPAIVGLTPNMPAKVIPLDLAATPAKYRAKNGAFFASLGNAGICFDFDCNPITCCCGGQGCVRQTIHGDGVAFLSAMGTITTKTLETGEVLVVDTSSLVAWESTATLGVRTAGGMCTCCCGGEGLFNTTLTGPGKVFFQSMSKEKFQAALSVAVQAQQMDRVGQAA